MRVLLSLFTAGLNHLWNHFLLMPVDGIRLSLAQQASELLLS